MGFHEIEYKIDEARLISPSERAPPSRAHRVWRAHSGERALHPRWRRLRKGHSRVHELSLMECVVDEVIDRLGAQPIAIVRLQIGELAGVAIEALQFCFEACARDTTLEGAMLDIVSVPARGRCRSCGATQAMSSLAAPCTCGSFDRELIAGTELRLVEVEVR
jgi:hydrogenase nickel incorporation protein HypA/HybF